MAGTRKRQLTDKNIGDETLRLFFAMVKKLNGEFMKDSTLKHIINISTLEEREVKILLFRYKSASDVKNTLDDASEVFGISRERIRQIIDKTMRKLRQPSRQEALRDFIKNKDYTCPYDDFSCLSIKFEDKT